MTPEVLEFIEKEKVITVEPDTDLQEVVARNLLRSGSDFSMNTVIYPGKRPAHYLRFKLAEKTGGPFIPPLIYSMDDFVLHMHAKLFDARPIDSMDGVVLIYQICKRMNLLNETFSELDNFFPLGERIFSLIEELYIEYVTPERIKEVELLIDVPLRSVENLNFISTVYSIFYEEMKGSQMCTRSKRYVDIAECEDLGNAVQCERLIFSGFYAFTKAEKKIIKSFSEKEGFLFIYQKEGDITADKRNIYFYSAPDLHGEVKIVGEIVHGKDRKEDMAIILPRSDALFPLLRHGISNLDQNTYNVSTGYPLSRTPIYGFFLNLFEVIETFRDSRIYVPSYLKFLLHPYTKNIELAGSSESGRIVLHGLEKILREDIPISFAEISWIEEELPARIEKLASGSKASESEIKNHIEKIHSSLLEPFFQIGNVRDFFEKCASVLTFIYEKSTARYHPLFYPYVEGYLNELKRISSSLLGEHVFQRDTSYFNLFRRLFSSLFFPFEGDPKAKLQVLGFLETRNLKFETIIFVDANEGVFPDLSEDYFLPYKVRRILGLSTYKEREDLIYHYFNTLLCGAKEVHLVYVENAESVRSRFIERIIWEMEKKRGSVIEERSLKKVINYRVSLTNLLPSPVEKTEKILSALEKTLLSPSALDDYLKCGIRFYLRYVLKIKEEERLKEIDRREIGNIVHSALRKFFEKRLKTHLAPERGLTDEMGHIVRAVFEHKYGQFLDGKAYLTKRQVEKRLKDFIVYLLETVRSHPVRIIAVEEYVEEELLGAKFAFRIDLVLEKNGSVEIVDFKTSGERSNYLFNAQTHELFRKKEYHKLPSLQIPLYRLLYSKKYSLDPKLVGGFYLLLGEKNLNQGSLLDPFMNLNIESAIELVNEMVRAILKEMKDRDTPFSPPRDVSEICPSCAYRSLCGTLWVESRDKY